MKKLKSFSVILAAIALLALGLASCKLPDFIGNEQGGNNGNNNNGNSNNNNDNGNNNGGTTKAYTVTFDANGGSGSVPSVQTVNAGYSINLPNEGGLTRTGYNFVGWTNNAAGTGNVFQPGKPYTPGGNITLYAKWTLNQYIVIFNTDGGTPTPTWQSINHGGKVTAPAAMIKTGYTFGGWFKEDTLINQWDFATDTVTGNITLYAKWWPNTAGITLDVKQITEGAPVINGNITISRTGSNSNPVTFPVTVSNASEYTGIEWEIAGAGIIYAGPPVTGSGATFTLSATDSRYNSFGGHVLILTVTKNGQQYQRAIPFTIVQ